MHDFPQRILDNAKAAAAKTGKIIAYQRISLGHIPEHFIFGKKKTLGPDRAKGVPESLWKPHKSKDIHFLHRSYIPTFFSTPPNFFLDIDKIIFENFPKIRENPRKISISFNL